LPNAGQTVSRPIPPSNTGDDRLASPIAPRFVRALGEARLLLQPSKSAALLALPVNRHALGTATAALLALWLAYRLELDTPYSAAATVMLVSSPVQGMILSKSLYRLAGTLVGAVAAVVLIALFAQAPELFMLGFSLWMGLCVALSTLLHSFRSYAAVLAGFTVVLIIMPAVDQPQSIFDLAMARVAVVSLGVVCLAVVTSLLAQRSAAPDLERRLRDVLGRLCAGCAAALTRDGENLSRLRRELAPQIGGLDAMITFAAAESPEINLQSDDLQGAAAAMFGVLTAAERLREAVSRRAGPQVLTDLLAQARHIVEDLDATLPHGDLADLDRLREALRALRQDIEDAFDPADLSLLATLDRLDDLIDELALCLEGLTNLLGRRAGRRYVAIKRHLDWRWSAINGARAAIAIWLIGAIWYLSAWPLGGAMVTGAVPILGLLSLRDRPTADAIGFFWGTALASLAGYFYLTWVLPQITDFALLAMWLGPAFAVGAAFIATPKYFFVATGFSVFFITLLAPSNPMRYDPENFINTAFATMAGSALTALIYRLVLPVDAKRLKRFLAADIQSDLLALLQGTKPIQRAAWEGLMHRRLLLLGARLRAAGIEAETSLRGGFAALRLGREALRIREGLIAPDALAIAQPAIAALADAKVASPARIHACRVAAENLAALALKAPRSDAAALGRAAASLAEIAILAGRQRRFFQLAAKR